MDDAQIWAHIDEQRADLADLLDTLTPEQWETPSLCQGWTVRQAAAHVTQSTTNWTRVTFELMRSGFRFNALTLRMAREDHRRPEEITAAMRAMVGGRRRPPGTAVADPLVDVLVHGQDIAVPLGIPRTMPVPAAVIAAERLWTMGFPFNARRRFPNLTFAATDADFSVGDGDVVRGPIQDIVMTLSGRRAGLPVE
ncbi:maleylpyruvate isomerase family mycothiol-dependent enzyme [Mycolicibacterium stellerae]|uniref:maleylpyruvate isomerase family mycothiol-dependent enzyme n=1 Tax=Mycolicibacterium stellerae TaxID=2358193 RepID=UPI000F0B0FEA|nr:maleylpyruvate isomerase family mycothiol-dependent enzyme [Mycolicibacterium stellerae]